MMEKIVLASASPRRKELLAQIGIVSPIIAPADADESVFGGLPPEEMVKSLAALKAETAAGNFPKDHIVIGSDTVVVADGVVCGKPQDREDAEKMIRSLSGRSHEVLTGLCVIRGEEKICELGKAEVWFRTLSENEIKGYCSTNEPYDKAGAYGIQGLAAAFAERIDGDYYSIVGLPLCALARILSVMGVSLF